MVEMFADSEGGSAVFRQKERFKYESWYEYNEQSTDAFRLGFYHHGERDEGDWKVISTEEGVGMLYGYFTNTEDENVSEVISDVLETPQQSLNSLDGSFALLAANANRLVVATDKLGSRPIYFIPDSPGTVATHPGALVPSVDNPEVNIQAISEMLQTGFAWGEKTLVQGVRSLPVASYLVFEGDTIRKDRYWQFSGNVDHDNYVHSVYKAFQDAVESVEGTVDVGADVGTYLSGGLDSRLLCGLICQSGITPISFTYDANPGDGVNLNPAKRLAEDLSIDNELLDYSPERTVDYIEESVLRTSGLQSWHEFHGLPGKLDQLPESVNTIFWGAGQGELFGEDVPHDICQENPVENFSTYWGSDIAEKVLNDPPEIEETFEQEYNKNERDTAYEQATDLIFRNYYSNAHARANVERTVAGFRCVHAESEVIEESNPVPPSFRWGPEPEYLNQFGHSISPLKLELVRHHDQELVVTQYERTGLSPKRSLYLHDIVSKLEGIFSKSNGSLQDRWYRENNEVQNVVDNYIDDIIQRRFVDGKEILNLQEEHRSGSGFHIDPLAKLVTIEIWLQNYLDPVV